MLLYILWFVLLSTSSNEDTVENAGSNVSCHYFKHWHFSPHVWYNRNKFDLLVVFSSLSSNKLERNERMKIFLFSFFSLKKPLHARKVLTFKFSPHPVYLKILSYNIYLKVKFYLKIIDYYSSKAIAFFQFLTISERFLYYSVSQKIQKRAEIKSDEEIRVSRVEDNRSIFFEVTRNPYIKLSTRQSISSYRNATAI